MRKVLKPISKKFWLADKTSSQIILVAIKNKGAPVITETDLQFLKIKLIVVGVQNSFLMS